MILGLGGTTPTPVTVNGHDEKMEDDERATRDRGNEEVEGIDVLLGVDRQKKKVEGRKGIAKECVSEREIK